MRTNPSPFPAHAPVAQPHRRRGPRTMALAAGAATITAAALLLGGCGSSTTSDNGPTTSETMPDMPGMSTQAVPAAPSTSAELTISTNKFDVPATLTPGQTLTIHNKDNVEHSVTSDEAGLFSVDIPANGTASLVVPDQPGTYPFHCKYHSFMHGTMTVS